MNRLKKELVKAYKEDLAEINKSGCALTSQWANHTGRSEHDIILEAIEAGYNPENYAAWMFSELEEQRAHAAFWC